MKIKSLFVLITVLILTTMSAAQDGAVSALQGSLVDSVGLPGQGWTSIGNLSPIEHNNFYVQSYVEQSAAIFSTYSGSLTVTPFVSMGLVLDTKGYDWNNKIQPRLGMKVNKYFRKGVISVGSAYTYEERFKGVDSSGLTLFVQDWFGWQPVMEKSSRFPRFFLDRSRKPVAGREGKHSRHGLHHAGNRGEKIQPIHCGAVRRGHQCSVTARVSTGTTKPWAAAA